MRGMTLTDSGRTLLAKAVLGSELRFTRGALGDGELPGGADIRSFTHLLNLRHNLLIIGLKRTEIAGSAELEFELTNSDIASGFFAREYGIYAIDPDTGDEVLYAYCNKEDEAPYIEAFNGSDPITFNLTFLTVIDQAENVTANITQTNHYVTHTRLEQIMMGVYQVLDNLNARVNQFTKSILDLTRGQIWGTADIMKMYKELESQQEQIDRNTQAELDTARALLWGTADDFKTERRFWKLDEEMQKIAEKISTLEA